MLTASGFLAGLGIGLALIVPIGPQNIYVINTGIDVGYPRVLLAVGTAMICDWLLIITGALGGAAALNAIPSAQTALLLVGAVFLIYLGVQALRADVPVATSQQVATSGSLARIVSGGVGVSLLNPHAILDTTVVIGSAIAAQAAHTRLGFALGALSASLVWFMLLGTMASVLREKLTHRARVMIERLSGIILLLFALKLLHALMT